MLTSNNYISHLIFFTFFFPCFTLFSQTNEEVIAFKNDFLIELNNSDQFFFKKVEMNRPTFYSSRDTCSVHFLLEVPFETQTVLFFLDKIEGKPKEDLKTIELGNIMHDEIYKKVSHIKYKNRFYKLNTTSYSILPKVIPLTNDGAVFFDGKRRLPELEIKNKFYSLNLTKQKNIFSVFLLQKAKEGKSIKVVNDAEPLLFDYRRKKGLLRIYGKSAPYEFDLTVLKIIRK